jgi:predicted  nucleic acid-binding Zn-ribbon protein
MTDTDTIEALRENVRVLQARLRDVEIRNSNLRTRLASATEAHQLAIAEIRRLERDVEWEQGVKLELERQLAEATSAAAETMPARRGWRGWGGG